jgi:hypothetical protein
VSAFWCGTSVALAVTAASDGKAWWAAWFTVLAAANGAMWVLP